MSKMNDTEYSIKILDQCLLALEQRLSKLEDRLTDIESKIDKKINKPAQSKLAYFGVK